MSEKPKQPDDNEPDSEAASNPQEIMSQITGRLIDNTEIQKILSSSSAMGLDENLRRMVDIAGAAFTAHLPPGVDLDAITGKLAFNPAEYFGSSVQDLLSEIEKQVQLPEAARIAQELSVLNQSQLQAMSARLSDMSGIADSFKSTRSEVDLHGVRFTADMLYPSSQYRMAEAVIESNQVNKEILAELRRQNRLREMEIERVDNSAAKNSHLDNEDDLDLAHYKIELLEEPLDSLDAALSQSFERVKSKFDNLILRRDELTVARVKYFLYLDLDIQTDPIYLGQILLRKTPGNLTEVLIGRHTRGKYAPIFLEVIDGWKTLIEFDKSVAENVRERGRKKSNDTQTKPLTSSNRASRTKQEWREIIPNRGDDWVILEMWDNHHTNSEIARRVHRAARTISNRISALRLRYPEAKIPTDEERRKSLQK